MANQFSIVGEQFFPDVKKYCNHNQAKSCVKDMLKADKKGKIVIKFVEKAINSSHIGNEKVTELIKTGIKKIEQNKKGNISKKVTKKAKELKKHFEGKVKDLTKSKKKEASDKPKKEDAAQGSGSSSTQPAVKPKTLENRIKALPQDLIDKIGSYIVPDIICEVEGNLDDERLKTLNGEELKALKPWILQMAPQMTTLDLTPFRISNERLQELVKTFTNVEKLHLSNADDQTLKIITGLKEINDLRLPRPITNEQLTELVAAFPNLRKLHLDIQNANDKTLEILSGLNNVTELHLTAKGNTFSDQGLAHLQKLQAFEELQIFSECENVTDAGIENISTLAHLKQFSMTCPKITDASLESISKLSGLEYLYLGSCNLVTDAGINHLAALTKLEVISVLTAQATNESLKTFGQLKSLEYLEFCSNQKITGDGLQHFANLKELKYLKFAANIRDNDLSHFSHLHNLQILILSSSKIVGVGCKHLASLKNLRHLHLLEFAHNGRRRYVGDKIMQEVKKLKQLQTLRLNDLSVPLMPDPGFKALGELSQLEFLEIDYCKMREESFQELSKLKKLKTLKFKENGVCKPEVAETGFLYLAKLKRLKSFTWVDVTTDRMLDVISRITTLEALTIGEDADNQDQKITDEGIEEMASQLTKLQDLELNMCHELTTKSIEYLAKLNLKTFTLRFSRNITNEALNVLRNKGVHVEHPY